jgi:hypothetical protein
MVLACVAVHGTQLIISPPGDQIKLLGRGIMFICRIGGELSPDSDAPTLEWRSPDGHTITDTVGR